MPTEISALLAGQFEFLLPEIILAIFACVLFLGGTWSSRGGLWACVALLGLAMAAVFLARRPDNPMSAEAIYGTPLIFDTLGHFVRWIALATGALLVLFGWNDVPDRHAADFHACLLTIIAGTGLTALANDLVTLFLALELVSIPTYILLYLPRHDEEAQEAAMKYFYLSVLSSALMLFGFSYLYGLAGTTNIAALQQALLGATDVRQIPLIAQVALIMVVAGLGFRITAVPFHFYAPDVYQGTATVCAAMLAFVPKVVGFVALLRVLGFVLPPGLRPESGQIGMGLSDHVPVLFWFLAAVTMILGNLLALLQDNIKRLLAYSSVSHAGYMLVALASAPYLRSRGGPDGVEALLYYLVAYGTMTIGAFAVLSYLNDGGQRVETVDDLAGLSSSHPVVALCMAIFMFSLIGIPLTAGFTGKFLIFFGAMAVPDEHAVLFRILALIGMINAAIGGWYYLRIVAIMYLRQPLRPLQNRYSISGVLTLGTCAVLTLAFSVPPGAQWLIHAAHKAAGR